MRPRLPKPLRLPATAAVLLTLAFPAAAGAAAATATETITGGTLSFINGSPGPVAFPAVALDGTDQAVTKTQVLNIADARGNGAGWNLTATSTAFFNGSKYLPDGSTTLLGAPAIACDAGVTCSLPTNGITYPYTLPSLGAVAPAATKLYNSALSTGTGALTLTPTWRLLVPASASIGNYTATWTFSLVSGP